MRHRILQTLATVAAAVVLLAGAAKANAQCCDRVIIDNLSNCNPSVCIYANGAFVGCFTPVQGSNLIDLGACVPPTTIEVRATDRCGNVILSPGLGFCTPDIPISATCCVQICAATSGCFYTIRDGICAAGC